VSFGATSPELPKAAKAGRIALPRWWPQRARRDLSPPRCHRFSAQLNWISENQGLDATFAAGGASNPTDTLRTFKGKATYYYDQKYGATVQYFRTAGSVDDGLYNTGEPVTGSASGSPKNSGLVAELDWLPRRDLRLMLQYIAYQTFNGASSNYDGLGRNAKDNNTLYFVLWLMI